MARTYDALAPDLVRWMEKQHVFFVATAAADGHVNVSPKGYDTFRVLSPREVAYLDLTGSGVETIAHLRRDGRITIMFCAFEGPPRILRLYGRGQVHTPGGERFDDLAGRFDPQPGARAVITATLQRISSSCGYSIPYLAYQGERPTLHEWAERKGPDGLDGYRDEFNRRSIDGLDALT